MSSHVWTTTSIMSEATKAKVERHKYLDEEILKLQKEQKDLDTIIKADFEKDCIADVEKHAIPDEHLTIDDLQSLLIDQLRYLLYVSQGKSLYSKREGPHVMDMVKRHLSESFVMYRSQGEWKDDVIKVLKEKACSICRKISHSKEQCELCYCSKCQKRGHYASDPHCSSCDSHQCRDMRAGYVKCGLCKVYGHCSKKHICKRCHREGHIHDRCWTPYDTIKKDIMSSLDA